MEVEEGARDGVAAAEEAVAEGAGMTAEATTGKVCREARQAEAAARSLASARRCFRTRRPRCLVGGRVWAPLRVARGAHTTTKRPPQRGQELLARRCRSGATVPLPTLKIRVLYFFKYS